MLFLLVTLLLSCAVQGAEYNVTQLKAVEDLLDGNFLTGVYTTCNVILFEVNMYCRGGGCSIREAVRHVLRDLSHIVRKLICFGVLSSPLCLCKCAHKISLYLTPLYKLVYKLDSVYNGIQ